MLLFFSCSQPKLLVMYGTENRFLIYSDSTFVDGNISLEIDNCTLTFSSSDLESIIMHDDSRNHKQILIQFSNTPLSVRQIEDQYLINNRDTTDLFSTAILDFTFDSLILAGKFYGYDSEIPVRFIEHTKWDPQYQGEIYSEWKLNDKVIKKITWGFVD